MARRQGRAHTSRSKRKSKTRLRDRLIRALGLAEPAPRKRGQRESRRRGLGIIGLDVGRSPARISANGLLPLMALGLLVSLGVASLRIEMIRLRYALADTSLAEKRMMSEQRSLTAEKLRLRDPVHLAQRAQELGFVRPERLIILPGVDREAIGRGDTILAAVGDSVAITLDRP